MTNSERQTKGRGRLFENIVETVGDTPCIRINNLAPGHATVYVKAEFFNPAGSVKDRLALSIIETAERNGTLKPGQTVVEATSGNTGIGLAMVCAAKGYPLVVTMADSFSIERRKLMRFLGAKVILTPRALKGFGMVQKAKELADKNGWFLAHQFETEANAAIHASTTAREILAAESSGGATFAVAMQVAEKAPAGSVLLAMLPDTGERYLSTPLFDGIVEGMDDEEIAVMKSTPNYQMPA
jgi:cysteine synthase A